MNRDTHFPTIAVVIPNYNDSAYLPICLDSVLRQKVRPDQIIFVDDQSTDDSLNMARSALEDAPGSKVLTNPTCLGTMGALNEGLKQVTCDYALFLSSNDHLVDGIIERAKSSIAELGRPGVWSAMVWVADEVGHCKYVYPSAVIALKDAYFSPDECIRMAMKLGNWFTGTTLMFHRETLQGIGGFDTEYRGLADLIAALTVSSIKGAVFCPQPLGVMRMHSGGYLRRTLTDLDDLEAILAKIEVRGPRLSPGLFTNRFCSQTKHRIRFAALRASGLGCATFHTNWRGARYRLLHAAKSLLGAKRKLMTMLAFILLRPFDISTFIRYRLFGVLWVITHNWKNCRSGTAHLKMVGRS
jgi:glycosyltransferase involved in cell wall biosynthesis